jgi:HlyD family secretion protein
MTRVVSIVVAVFLVACSGPPVDVAFQGYVEGEFVQVGSPLGGTLESLAVARGQNVAAGAPLFALERATETAAVAQTEAQLKAAQARLTNLGQGRRLPEINALQASVDNAGAALRLSTLQLAQHEKLAKSGFISDTALAAAQAAKERDTAQLANALAQLATARLSLGRDAELAAALAESDAARAALEQAKTRVAQKVLLAPVAARVQDTFFTVGELVPPAAPVVNLLPPGNVKLRFFVPETVVATIKPGRPISATCDACGIAINAKVSYVSSQAEYTPPVIYGRDSRAKLVYLIEARPDGDAGQRLTPGQPVDVRLKLQ